MVLSQVQVKSASFPEVKEPFLEETVSQAGIGVKLPSSTVAHTH